MKRYPGLKRSVLTIISLVWLLLFAYLQIREYLIPGLIKILESPIPVNVHHIGLMWVPIVAYLLMASIVCLTVSIFKKLKGFKEVGGLTCMFHSGLIEGFLLVILSSIFIGIIFPRFFTTFLIFGPFVMLGRSFVMAIIIGFINEFKRDEL